MINALCNILWYSMAWLGVAALVVCLAVLLEFMRVQ